MNISRVLTLLSKNEPAEEIEPGIIGYFQARTRNKLHDVVLNEFIRSGISKSELAKRLGKEPAQVTRWLGAPGNWTIDTVSNLLLAISGGVLKSEVEHPHSAPIKNMRAPDWYQVLPVAVSLEIETHPQIAGPAEASSTKIQTPTFEIKRFANA